ncbi:MAG: hypothetical protein ACI8R8_001968 [Paraglaciecola sp.]|jgi:hypothetical protein
MIYAISCHYYLAHQHNLIYQANQDSLHVVHNAMTKISYNLFFPKIKAVNKWLLPPLFLAASANDLLLLNVSKSPVSKPRATPCATAPGVNVKSIHCYAPHLEKPTDLPQYVNRGGEHASS